MSRPPFFSENAHAIFMLRWKESLILDLFDIIAPPFFAPAHGNLIMKSVFDGETAVRCPDAATCCLIKKDKDKEKGHVLGDFATTDHTGIPVPLMAYGPGAAHFQGFLDNAELARRIYQLLSLLR